MAHLKHINRAYISKKLKEGLGELEYKRYNYICAPTGYGKTLVCSTFYKNYSRRSVLWIDADTTPDIFWQRLCTSLKVINATYAHELLMAGFPYTDEDIRKITYILDMFPSKESEYIIVIDNFDKIPDDMLSWLFAVNCIKSQLGISFVFVVKSVINHRMINLILKNEAGFVGTDMLSFDVEDIKDFYRVNELVITHEEAQDIYDKTYGWPYAVEVYVCNHNMSDKHIMDILDSFIYTNMWLDCPEDIKEFLLKLSVLGDFTLTQCVAQTGRREGECYDILMGIGFVKYNDSEHTYTFNPVFRHFISDILANETSEVIYNITLNAAHTYMASGSFYEAIELYARVGHYQEIYDSDISLGKLYAYVIKSNKDTFFDIANHYWSVEKNGHYEFAVVISFIMFLFNERHTLTKLLSDIREDISNDKLLTNEQIIDYNAALTYISAFLEYNDFKKMNEKFEQVAGITQKPLEQIAGQFPFTFECPSVLSIYHSAAGELDYEKLALEECASNYYRITNGHGKGFEALMKAEVLYNRGDIDSAEILCHKALYMADGRNQFSIYISATFIMTLIAIYKGANDEFKQHMDNMTHIVEKDSYVPQHMLKMVDICKSYIYSNLSSPDNMSEWMKDYRRLELSMNFHSLGFANIILGKYLILTGDYHKFLGISGQFLGLNHIYSYVTANIYTYIYLSIANNETGEKEKAHKFMLEALNLAVPDRMYMPFVHNYSYIGDLLLEVGTTKDISIFVKSVQKLAKPYEKGVKAINKAGRLLADYGLTVREADVAKLAAKRLTNKEIAEQLFIAESTVKSNMKMIFNKLQINSRAELKNFFD